MAGVRRVAGARRRRLGGQFGGESAGGWALAVGGRRSVVRRQRSQCARRLRLAAVGMGVVGERSAAESATAGGGGGRSAEAESGRRLIQARSRERSPAKRV